ncbi:hypothetical protein Y049_1916 [Burkholderia pseudomallei MSHR684]|nr:hypothetical protein Y049_1916 [Burkholderia pseudomallei MSHR684]
MSKQKLTILQVIQRGGISKRTGQPWEIHTGAMRARAREQRG